MHKKFLIHCLVLVFLFIGGCQSAPATTPQPSQIVEPTKSVSTVEATSLPPSPTPASGIVFVDSGQEIGTGPASDVALGDLDKDGDLDAFVVYGQWDQTAPNKVYLNDGKGNFTDSGHALGNKISYAVGLGDFDQDGDLDAFVSNGNYDKGDENEIWFNQGNGQFKLEQSIGKTNGMVLVGDLNGDGYPDAFLCNHILSDGSNGGHRVYLNDRTGHFIDSEQILGGHQESRMGDLGDIDNDGDLDVVLGTYASGVEIWVNDGTGHFEKGEQLLGSQQSWEVALGDLDGSGSLDAFVSHSEVPSEVWLNTVTSRQSHFETKAQESLSEGEGSGVSLGDLDGDGDLDAFLLTSKWETNSPSTIWENDGKGNFSDSSLQLGNDESQGVALGDLNGDGLLDAFVANRTTPSRVYFNHSNPKASATSTKTANLMGDYMGQTPPGSVPVVFAPGVISVEGKNDHTLSFSPDGQEVYFTRDPDGVTMFMRRENGLWTQPQVAPFHGREALFSPDGNRLFFNDGDLWFVQSTADGWSEPYRLDAPVNSSEHDYYASMTRAGTLYFSRLVDDRARIFRSPLVNGRYAEVEELGAPINDSSNNYHPFVAPDESYLIFNSMRTGGFGDPDLYVSFRRANGSWTEPANLGASINSSDGDLCPVVSPDGKYLFFTRYRDGAGDIYWVSSAVIDLLKTSAK